MALASVSLNDSVTVLGRVLAREGEVTLINDVLGAPQCATASTPTPNEPAVGGSNGTPSTSTPVASSGKKKHGQGEAPGGKMREGTATLNRGKKGATGIRASGHGH